jgi:hypothetical protein
LAAITPESQNQWRYERDWYFHAFLQAIEVKLGENEVLLTGSDLKIDNAGRRINQAGFRRALVHGVGDKLIINFGNDYPAGVQVESNLNVTKDLNVVGSTTHTNADIAEEFDTFVTEVEPGTVMVFNSMGNLVQSYQPYDKKVAGIISGADNYKPGIILDKKGSTNNNKRIPIALMGKVYCKADATLYSIEVGDLLTTSSTKGHAMKAEDPLKAFGAVIGKALGSIKEGLGIIPVLVALQ